MTKPVSISKKPRKQHTPEFRNEALKLAERIGVAAAARELNLYESQLYAWRSKQQQQMSSSERESELAAENVRLKRQLAEQAEELAILQKAATYFAKLGKGKRVICVSGYDLYHSLSHGIALPDLLDAKLRHAAETGEPYAQFDRLYTLKGIISGTPK